MAAPSLQFDLADLLGDAPVETHTGSDDSILMVMTGLGASPPTGRLLRGLTPWLDSRGVSNVYLFTERKWREPWQESQERVTYQEIVFWSRDAEGGTYRGATWHKDLLPTKDIVQAFRKEPQSVVDYAARLTEAAVISSAAPLLLSPHPVAKPWGRECWYTGIEKRGLSQVRSPSGSTDLPYALGMFPYPLIGDSGRAPILLKTLEPHPEAVYGDLYLEVHEEKWETYVVLSIDPAAWPKGIGELKAGLAPDAIERYRSIHGETWAAALTEELSKTIKSYENLRRDIDGRIDEMLQEAAGSPGDPVAPAEYLKLVERLPADLVEKEQKLRRGVEAFIGSVPLHVGDVVALPPGIIHSLRHGVKVVEFQTPTYERLIAMFAQKVVTQQYWDTKQALAKMDNAAYRPDSPQKISVENGCVVERAVDYPEFLVDRLTLAPNGKTHEALGEAYHLLFVVEGVGTLLLPDGTQQTLVKEDALLMPVQMGGYEMTSADRNPLVWLKAVPREIPPESD